MGHLKTKALSQFSFQHQEYFYLPLLLFAVASLTYQLGSAPALAEAAGS